MNHPPVISGNFRLRIWDEYTNDTLFSGCLSSVEFTSSHDVDPFSAQASVSEEVTITLNRCIYPPHSLLWRTNVSNNWLRRFGCVVRRLCNLDKARRRVRP